jgi:hypothetical protein
MPGAWAYERVEASADAVRRALPDIVGGNGMRLVLRGNGEPIGPPTGSVRYQARWHSGRATGEADVLVFPVSSALCELHVTLHPVPGLMWRGARLVRLAKDLAGLVADAAGSGRAVAASRRDVIPRRVSFLPATGGARPR